MHRLPLLLVAISLLPGCFPYQRASSGAVGCPPEDIDIRDKLVRPGPHGPTRTWTAICGDTQHLCSAGGASGTAACKEVFARDPRDRLNDFRVARGFSPQLDAQTIEAHLRIDVRRSLDLFATPTVDPNVRVTVRLLTHRNVPCEAVSFTANSAPVPSTPIAAHPEGSTHRLDASVGEALIRELRRPNPTLSLEGCGQTVALDQEAMATLSEFTRMYDDLAKSAGGTTPKP